MTLQQDIFRSSVKYKIAIFLVWPQLATILHQISMNPLTIAILLTYLVKVGAIPVSTDSMEDDFLEEEFDYFYNLELVERLELVGDDNEVTDEEVNKIVNDFVDSPDMDGILDKMQLQGTLMEEVLSELDGPSGGVVLTESSDFRPDFSSSLLYEILYWLFLACFIVMLTFSLLMTTKYILDNPRHGDLIQIKKDMDFVFLPTRSRI